MSNSNKALVIEVLQTVFVERDTSIVSTHFSNNYIQHNPLIPNGSESIPPMVAAASGARNATPSVFHQRHIGRVLRSS